MKSDSMFFIRKLIKWVKIFIPYLVYCLPFVFPLPKIAGKSIRQGMGFELLIAFILIFSGLFIKNDRRWISKSIFFSLFGIALSTLWVNSISEWQVAGGNLFFSDSSQYYADALRLLNGIQYSTFSARHPFGTMFLSTLLWLTGSNIKLAFFVITLMASAVTWMATEEVWNKWGSLPAAFFCMLLFLFYRRFIGMPDCENLGYIFGCLSFTIILKSYTKKNEWLFLIGFVVLAAGLMIRPGAWLVIPTIVIGWSSKIFQSRSKYFAPLMVGIFSILFFFIFGLFSNGIASKKEGRLFSNFSYTLYGITNGGKGWELFQNTHPTEQYASDIEAEKAAFSEAINTFVGNPKQTLTGVVKSYGEFFSLKPGSVLGFLGFDLYNDSAFGSERYQKFFGTIARLAIMILSSIGLYSILRNREKCVPHFLLLLSFGVFLSIPFLPPNDAGMMRVYCVTMPFLFILPGIGLFQLSNFKTDDLIQQRSSDLKAPILLSILLLLMISSSLFIYKFSDHQDLSRKFTCPHSNQIGIVSELNTGSYIDLVTDDLMPVSTISKTRISDFQNSYFVIPKKELILPLDTLIPNSLLFNSIDLLTGNQILISIPSSNEKWNRKTIIICGNLSNEFSKNGIGFLIGEDVKIFEE